MKKKAILEGLLFLVGEDGLSLEGISSILGESDFIVLKLLDELKIDYEREDRGLSLEKLGNQYKITTKKEYREYYQKLVEVEQSMPLSQSALETLAIIAYKQPITRSQIDEIRGISSVHMVRKLMAKNLIEEKGKSDFPGKPILYGTTVEFLDYFGINALDELPAVDLEEENSIEMDLFETKYRETV